MTTIVEGQFCMVPRTKAHRKRERESKKWRTAAKRKRWRNYHWKMQNGKCFYCKAEIAKDEATLDHVVPLSKGGPDDLENGVAACASCNHIKGDGTHPIAAPVEGESK